MSMLEKLEREDPILRGIPHRAAWMQVLGLPLEILRQSGGRRPEMMKAILEASASRLKKVSG